MRWTTFLLTCYVFLVAEAGLHPLWTGLPWVGNASPRLLLGLLAFVALWGEGMTALWACLLLGLLVDLTECWVADPGARGAMYAVVGPHALGFLAAGYVASRARKVVFRESPVTLAIFTFGMGVMAHLVATALLGLRGVWFPLIPWVGQSPIPGWDVSNQLVYRFFLVLYSAALAWPVGWGLVKMRKWWGFDAKAARMVEG